MVIDDVAENIRNERHADAIDRNPTLECADRTCDATTGAKEADGWLLENDPEIPILCPDCREETAKHKLTPTETRRDRNHDVTEWSG